MTKKTTQSIKTNKDFTGKIFCLMGKSASGKDTLYKKVLSKLENTEEKSAVKTVTMYTTRPRRSGEAEGVEYNFITPEALEAFTNAGLVVERRDYDTKHGVWSYATIHDGQIIGDNNYFMIETPEGVAALSDYYGSEHVIALYVSVDDGVRLMRALLREMSQDEPKYEEMCRRYLSDAEDFREIDKIVNKRSQDEEVCDGILSKVNYVHRFVNDELNKCAGDIATFIEKNI